MKAKALVALLEAQRINVCKSKRAAKYLLELEGETMDKDTNKKFDSLFNSLGTLIKHANKAVGFDFAPAKYDDKTPISGPVRRLNENYNANSEMAVIVGWLNGIETSLESIEEVKSILNDRTLDRTEVSKGFKTARTTAMNALEELKELLPDLVDEEGVAETAEIIKKNEGGEPEEETEEYIEEDEEEVEEEEERTEDDDTDEEE